ncbi:MAG: hypothetical protein H6907_13615 [Hyphomicrobiales bacterium]|nr:hypothetical protein [Hyphomicrobiales bacterium]
MQAQYDGWTAVLEESEGSQEKTEGRKSKVWSKAAATVTAALVLAVGFSGYEQATGILSGSDRGSEDLSGFETAAGPGVTSIPDHATASLQLVVFDAAGRAGQPIPLQIMANPSAGTEISGITVSGLPEGARLSSGRAGDGGNWTLTTKDLEGLFLTTSDKAAGEIDLMVSAAAKSVDTDSAATAMGNLRVKVRPKG